MTRGDLNRLQGQMNRMRQSLQGVNRTTASAGRNSQMLGRDLAQLSARFIQMNRTGRMTRRELDAMNNTLVVMSRTARNASRSGEITRSNFRNLRNEISRMRAELRLLGRDGNVFQRMGDRLLLFQHRMRDTNNHAGVLRRSLNRMGDGAAGGLRGALLGTLLLAGAMKKLGSIINVNKRWTVILLAALLLIGPAASALGALLVTALGGAFIALGALALKNSTTVRGAFSAMKESVARDVREAAQPMEGHLAQGIYAISDAISVMKPALESAFRATGPLIEDFVGAFTDLAAMSMPGIINTLESLGPAMEGFRTAMGLVGQGIGDMFSAMTAGGGAEALKDVWITLGVELANLLKGIGEFINMANQSGTSTLLLIGFFRSLSGVLNIVEFALRSVDSVFGGLFQNLNSNITGLDKLTGGIDGIGASFVASGQDAESLKRQLADVNKEIKRIEDYRKSSKIVGPAKEYANERAGAGEEDLKKALKEREALTKAITEAEAGAASKTRDHAAAVDALKKSIQELNEQTLGRLDAKSAMEKAIDDAAAKAKEIKGKVSITGGLINMDTEAGREAQEILGAIAKTTSEYVTKLQEAKAPQNEINAAWARGREQLIGLSGSLGVSKADLEAYADTVLQTPESVVTRLKVEKEQADAAVAAAIAKIESVPDEEKSRVTLEAHRAMERASQVTSQLDALDGRTATATLVINQFKTTTIKTIQQYQKEFLTGQSQHDITGATGGLFTGSSFTKRGPKMAQGGRVSGPGTGTSDDIFAPWLSDGEFVVNARQTRKYQPLIEAINNDKLKLGPMFAKGGLSDSSKQARKDLTSSFGISLFGQIAGYQRTPFTKGLGAPGDITSLVSTLNSTLSQIRKAFSGAQEKKLAGQLVHTGKFLIQHQKNLDKVNKALTSAKDKLDGLKQAAASLKASVTSGVMSATNVTKAASGDKNVTMADVMAQMRQSVDKSGAFSKALADLKNRGVSKEIIQQIAEAGIEGGGLETAGAILGGSDSEIATMNEMQKKINASAASAGKTAADAMYAAGIKAAEGVVRGLTSKKKAIEKAMMDIAKAMEKAIKKALGIKSPSRVMQQVGDYTAEGFALGMRKNKNVDTSWMSMLNVGPSASGTASVGSVSRGGGQYVFPIYIGNTKIDEVILDSNRRTVRTRGGNAQAVFGR